MMLGTVDTMMVGRVGADALAAAAIGNAWFYAVMLMGQGVVHGIDPFVTQAHGARDSEATAVALQRGVVIALLISVPLIGLLTFTEEVLLIARQDPALAKLAQALQLSLDGNQVIIRFDHPTADVIKIMEAFKEKKAANHSSAR